MSQSEFNFSQGVKASHGGRRKNAGRPKKVGAMIHSKRPTFNKHTPLHVTVRVKKGVPSLRSKDLFKDFKNAVKRARLKGFKIIHFNLLSNHLHLILEVEDKRALEGAMKSFLLAFAWRARARGYRQIFERRYHLTLLKNPTLTRNALRYVLLNEEKHKRIGFGEVKSLSVTPFSSCFQFEGWKQLIHIDFKVPKNRTLSGEVESVRELLCAPDSWLLREGWARAVA